MSTVALVEQLKQLSNPERLEVIEVATQLIRQELSSAKPNPRKEQDRRMRDAALALKHLYEPGGELTEWTSLDGEDMLDDYVQG